MKLDTSDLVKERLIIELMKSLVTEHTQKLAYGKYKA